VKKQIREVREEEVAGEAGDGRKFRRKKTNSPSFFNSSKATYHNTKLCLNRLGIKP
jgi:hypothetical protein